MSDLPDWYGQIQGLSVEATSFKCGVDAGKTASPVKGEIYLATDTHKLYLCMVTNTWSLLDASELDQGILTLYADVVGAGFEIKNIKDPTAVQSAATKNYVDTNSLTITTGGYAGDDTVNRAIPHGLGRTPTAVFIYKVVGDIWFNGGFTGDMTSVLYMASGGSGRLAVTVRDATNFHVGNATSYANSANASGSGYRWIAF